MLKGAGKMARLQSLLESTWYGSVAAVDNFSGIVTIWPHPVSIRCLLAVYTRTEFISSTASESQTITATGYKVGDCVQANLLLLEQDSHTIQAIGYKIEDCVKPLFCCWGRLRIFGAWRMFDLLRVCSGKAEIIRKWLTHLQRI